MEAALKAESDIGGKSPDVLHKELEGMMEASLEVRNAGRAASQEDEGGIAGVGERGHARAGERSAKPGVDCVYRVADSGVVQGL